MCLYCVCVIFRTLAFSTLKSKMHLILLDKKVFQGMKATYHLKVSKLNSRTPAKKIWDMIRKITGKNKNKKHVHIKSNGNICLTTKDVSNALGENFHKNSSSANYSETFQNIKQERERASKFYVTKS